MRLPEDRAPAPQTPRPAPAWVGVALFLMPVPSLLSLLLVRSGDREVVGGNCGVPLCFAAAALLPAVLVCVRSPRSRLPAALLALPATIAALAMLALQIPPVGRAYALAAHRSGRWEFWRARADYFRPDLGALLLRDEAIRRGLEQPRGDSPQDWLEPERSLLLFSAFKLQNQPFDKLWSEAPPSAGETLLAAALAETDPPQEWTGARWLQRELGIDREEAPPASLFDSAWVRTRLAEYARSFGERMPRAILDGLYRLAGRVPEATPIEDLDAALRAFAARSAQQDVLARVLDGRDRLCELARSVAGSAGVEGRLDLPAQLPASDRSSIDGGLRELLGSRGIRIVPGSKLRLTVSVEPRWYRIRWSWVEDQSRSVPTRKTVTRTVVGAGGRVHTEQREETEWVRESKFEGKEWSGAVRLLVVVVEAEADGKRVRIEIPPLAGAQEIVAAADGEGVDRTDPQAPGGNGAIPPGCALSLSAMRFGYFAE